MATSNYKKSKNYDTCVYVGEETDTIQSQFQETPIR